MITLNTVSIVLKTFHDVTSIYLPKKINLWCALLTDYTYIRLGYNPGERKKFSKSSHPLLFSQITPCQPSSFSGSTASWQTGSSKWCWENTHPAPVRSALELLRAVFSPHCSSLSTRTTAHLKTPLSSSWRLQTTPHWSASSRTVTSLLIDRRLRSWLSGAVLTIWSLTPTLLSSHLQSWTALWLQWSHSGSWAPPSPSLF